MHAGELTGVRAVVVNWRDLEHSLSGGAEVYAWQFARALVEGGAEVEFLTSRERGASSSQVREGIAVRRRGGRFGFYVAALMRLARRRRSTDLVIDLANGIPSFAPLVTARRTPVVLGIHHVHQDQFAVHFPGPVARLGRWLERAAAPAVYAGSRTVTVSESTRTEMRERLGWRGDVTVLPNGADHPAPARVEARDVDADRIVVLGRLVRHKRVDLALAAVAALVEERPGLGVDVVGRGPDRARLEQVATELGVADRVTFHGWVSEETKATLVGRAGVHVCASDAEGWGQTVIEAAGWGVPTVARDVPGLRDSVRDGETGWLVPDDADHDVVTDRLVAALRRALEVVDDPVEASRWSVACRARAHEFDWSRMRRDARVLVLTELSDRTARPGPLPRPVGARSLEEGAA